MQHTLQEFKDIDAEAALRSFLQKYGFRMADSRSHADQFVLGAFIGKLDGRHATVTHRLFDESTAASRNISQRNHVLLEVAGLPSVEVRFHGKY